MTLLKIQGALASLKVRKGQVSFAERDLQKAVSSFLMNRPESMRTLAGKLDLSVPYVSDIIHGRRKVSDAVVERLKRLK